VVGNNKKRGRKPKAVTPDDVLRVTGLTRDDLSALADELNDLCHDHFPHFLNKAARTHEGLLEYLTGNHVQFYVSPELIRKLRELIAKLQQPRTRDEIKRERWDMVRGCKDVFAWYGVSGPWAPSPYWLASFALEGQPAEAGPDMMKADYNKLQRTLPEKERRPKTYKKRRHPSYALKDALRLVPATGATSRAKVSEEQLTALEALIAEIGGEESEALRKRLAKFLKVETLSDFPANRFREAILALESKRDFQLRQQKAEG